MIPTYHESWIATWLNSLDLSETEEDSLANETVSEDIVVTSYTIKCPRKKIGSTGTLVCSRQTSDSHILTGKSGL